MKTTIHAYDPVTRQVDVTFELDGVEHRRAVNACHDADGGYDPDATADRVADVARGVAHKIAVGAIVTAPPADEPPAGPVEDAA